MAAAPVMTTHSKFVYLPKYVLESLDGDLATFQKYRNQEPSLLWLTITFTPACRLLPDLYSSVASQHSQLKCFQRSFYLG